MAIFYSDFGEYADIGAVLAAFPLGWEGAVLSASLVVDATAEGGKYVRLDNSVSSVEKGLYWAAVGNVVGDVDVKIKARTTVLTGQRFRSVIQSNMNTSDNANGYLSVVFAHNIRAIDRTSAGTITGLGATDVSNQNVVNTWYWQQIQKIGNTIRSRMWAVGSPEPGDDEWEVTAVDATFSGGYVGFAVGNVGGENDFDVIEVRTGSDVIPFDGATLDDSLTGTGGFDTEQGGELDTTTPIRGAGSYHVDAPDSWGEKLLSGIFGTTTTTFYTRFNNAPSQTTAFVTLQDDTGDVFSLYVDPDLRVSMDGDPTKSQKLVAGVVYRIEVTYRNAEHPLGSLREFSIAVGNGPSSVVASSTIEQLLYGLLWRFGILTPDPNTLDLTFDDVATGEDPDEPPPAIPELTETVVPAVPASLVSAEPTHSSVVLSWAVAADAVGYELRRSTDEVNWTVIGNVTSPYTDSGLAPETTYYYQVRSIGSEETSEWSASQSGTTGVAPDVPASRTSLSIGISI